MNDNEHKYIDKEQMCLNPECNKTASSRGLCHSCYGQAGELVRKRVTTWKALEEAGRALPAKRSGKITGTKQWLLGDKAP